MYLLNEFGLFGEKKKNNFLPKLSSKLGGKIYGAGRQVQGAAEGVGWGIELGKAELKERGRTKIKRPIVEGIKFGVKAGSKIGKAVGTVEGKIKGYKKGKELQNKLPNFSYTFVVEFAKKKLTEKEKTKAIRNSAILGTIATGIGGIGVYEDVKRAKNSIKDAVNNEKSILDDLAKNKKEMLKTHPDRFVGQGDDVLDQAKKKFQALGNKKEQLVAKQNSNARYVDAGKQKLKGIIKSIGYNIDDDAAKQAVLLEIDNLAKTGKYVKVSPKLVKQMAKIGKTSKIIGVGLTGATALGAAINTGRYLNRKRKERKDKGVLRGKYNK